jgi:hypothetical protein
VIPRIPPRKILAPRSRKSKASRPYIKIRIVFFLLHSLECNFFLIRSIIPRTVSTVPLEFRTTMTVSMAAQVTSVSTLCTTGKSMVRTRVLLNADANSRRINALMTG